MGLDAEALQFEIINRDVALDSRSAFGGLE
jgi:hypothetical protein